MIGLFSFSKVGTGEEAPRILANQMWPIGPVFNELTIVPAIFDHHAGEAKRQRAVAAGPDAKPLIRLGRKTRMARIDDDELCAPGLCLGDSRTVSKPSDRGIMAPQHHAVGVFEIGDGHCDAKAVGENHFLAVTA